MPDKSAKKIASSQTNLPLAGIEDGVIVLNDGSYRVVLQVSSTNFNLKSEQEQNALINAYQGFLNSLNFPVQIVMQSRHLDLEPYLKKLSGQIVEQQNELIKQQTEDYIAYVRELINVANIMDKKFYVTIPYQPIALVKKGAFSQLFSNNKTKNISINQEEFKVHRTELTQRAEVVANQLSTLGLRTSILDTDDLIKMLYMLYNYDVATEERLDHPQNLTEDVVSTEQPPEGAAPTPEEQMSEPPIGEDRPHPNPPLGGEGKEGDNDDALLLQGEGGRRPDEVATEPVTPTETPPPTETPVEEVKS